jgi:hypothetical protein
MALKFVGLEDKIDWPGHGAAVKIETDNDKEILFQTEDGAKIWFGPQTNGRLFVVWKAQYDGITSRWRTDYKDAIKEVEQAIKEKSGG